MGRALTFEMMGLYYQLDIEMERVFHVIDTIADIGFVLV